MLKFQNIKFDYDPYPVGLARGAFAPEVYRALVGTLPDDKVFLAKEYLGTKLSLSQLNNRAGYHAHLRQHAVWKRFYDYVKSEHFISETLAMLKAQNIDLGLTDLGWRDRVSRRSKAYKRGGPQPTFPKLRGRFEFSSIPVTGGSIRPEPAPCPNAL